MVTPPGSPSAVEFQGQDPQEVFSFYFRQHWIRMAWPSTRMLLWTAALLLFGYFLFFFIGVEDAFLRHSMLVVFVIIVAITQWEFMMRFYMRFLYVIIVTDRKIHRIKKTLFSIDDHQCLDLATIQDLHKKQHGLVQNLFGYGSLILEAQDTELRIHFVPKINAIYNRLLQARTDALRQHNALVAESKVVSGGQ